MENSLLPLFLGMALVTYLPRFLPLYVLHRFQIPRTFALWLSYVPAAVLAALVAPGLLLSEGQLFLSVRNGFLLAAFPTFAVALKTRNMLATILAGMVSILVFRTFL
jgi:branched-subunit amino acid transport protein